MLNYEHKLNLSLITSPQLSLKFIPGREEGKSRNMLPNWWHLEGRLSDGCATLDGILYF